MSDTDILEELQKLEEVLALPKEQRETFLIRSVLRHTSHFQSEQRARDAFRQEISGLTSVEKRIVEALTAYELRTKTKIDDEVKAREALCKTVLHLRLALAGVLGGVGALKWVLEFLNK